MFESIVFFSFSIFGFTTNADASSQTVFGKDINTWLIYVLIFLAATMLAFCWVWLSGFINERKEGSSISQPWE